MAVVTTFLMSSWWIPLLVIAPLAIVFLLAGVMAVAAPSPERRADAYRVVTAILQTRLFTRSTRDEDTSDA
ncbi:hypothetical protein ACFWB0_21415 [Rhodococcus sp. NPDC060086]|uniref:Uncharacterized protein n=1 Tax=Rhodococcus rhodochrous TaxID=1829 RepID=A0AA46X512_RHORH|nr:MULTISPECIES: hypothetical protein [Rhodococcus]UVT27840.1 hypothetical protein NXT08_24995 [Rhodococcus pyridinivorans]UZF48492.1 hypothetical protein KUM34_029410 [Rhodococcus rhodochrous]